MAVHDDPAQEAWELLWRVMQANKPRFMALAQEMNLAPMQLHALRLIEPGDGVPMSSLAGKLFCDASNVTGIVDRLEARGLVERRVAPDDRRVKQLVLTDSGRTLRQVHCDGFTQGLPLLDDLSADERSLLVDLLRRALGDGRTTL